MTGAIYTKSLRDRWVSTVVAAGALAAWLWIAMGVYSGIDLSIYTDLPEALRSVMGIPEGADAAALAYNVVLGTVGSLTLAGLAVSIGASSVAGEERDGTMGVLLANPVSRTQVLVSKAVAMLSLVATIAVVLWGAGYLVPALLSVEVGATRIGAMVLHLTVNAAFYGFLATAVGAWTGNRPFASGVSVAVMVVSFVAVGVLPLIDAVADLARLLPWYYFDSSDPLRSGIHWGHLSVLAVGAAVLLGASVVGVNRRDLRGPAAARSLLDRLRAHPLTQRVGERLAGGARVSRIWVKTATEHQGLTVVTAATMFWLMGVLMGLMFTFLDDTLAGVDADFFPEELLAFVGGGNLTTPEGFLQIETFGMMAPIATILVAVAVAVRGLAGEEADNTMGLLLANPVSRTRVVLEKSLAMLLVTVVVGVATFAGVAVGSLAFGLGMSIANIGAASALATLLGLVFGALALAIGAGTGRARMAAYSTVGVALTFHVVNAFVPFSDRFADWAMLSPFYYYLSNEPLEHGMHWGHAGVLALVAAALVGLAVELFRRRDLRPGR